MAKESKAHLIRRIAQEYQILSEVIPDPKCALNFNNPFELLIATCLSAQTTDKRVNSVTPTLFYKFPTPEALSQAQIEVVEDIIHPLGFYHVKAQNIIALSYRLVHDFNGIVPSTMHELTQLEGVGRKTANVVLGNAFNLPGFPVDTHVMRVTGRLRWRSDWKNSKPDPIQVEREITSYFPDNEWTNVSHRLILLGRAYCKARTPNCANCPLADTCPSRI
ncbi:MAG: endonuclease III [Bifidobacteriaceae bacterium]|nr:endonuclease III [Bifidobacteriaceae bacterium]